uniref:Cardioacceleratory protein 2b n=1 Tax=Manduca sexta TaxID=7130 RepID=Q7M3N2_MANSE|nr:cardioacceleratory peptide 2b [Manduca sexta]
ELYAFPRV